MTTPTTSWALRTASILATTAVALAGLSAVAPDAHAVTGRVVRDVLVHEGPHAGYDRGTRVLRAGQPIDVVCKTPGSPYAASRNWYKVGTRQYVPADAIAGADASAPWCAERLTNDYPYPASGGAGVDKWGFTKGRSTSFVSWRLQQRLGIVFSRTWRDTDAPGNPRWGEANTWDDVAPAAGVRVGTLPAVGSVAVSNQGLAGHVAYVTRVNTDGTFVVEEMNRTTPFRYTARTARVGTGASDFERFLYF